jgi:hypothetical protein
MLVAVIPTMLLIGLLVGRWAAVPLGGLGWVGVLLVAGTIGWNSVIAAVVVAAANAALGVIARRGVRMVLRRPGAVS